MRRIFPRQTSIVLVLAAASALGGCATSGPAPAPQGYAPDPVRLNPEYQAGAVYDTAAQPIPSLQQLLDKVPTPAGSPDGTVDVLRSPAMREGAMAYGAQGGLAWETRANNLALNSRAAEFDRIYDFDRVLIEAPGHTKILPPVISLATEAWETSDAGRTLRVADTVYRKVEEARFTPNAPKWQSYLMRAYVAPKPPADVLLPTSRDERARWNAWMKEGWEAGRVQAQEILKSDLAKLDRDFQGMLRYKALLEEGKVSAPVLADSNLGVTGSGEDMRVGDRAVTITQDPKFQVTNPSDWRATPTTPGPDGPTGQDPAKARTAEAVRPEVVAAPAEHARPRTTAQAAGGGRRAW